LDAEQSECAKKFWSNDSVAVHNYLTMPIEFRRNAPVEVSRMYDRFATACKQNFSMREPEATTLFGTISRSVAEAFCVMFFLFPHTVFLLPMLSNSHKLEYSVYSMQRYVLAEEHPTPGEH
jgi:hypothetical protein